MNDSDNGLISIIIPTHKRSKLLEHALLSIRALNINSKIEIIVASDIIDLETSEVCSKYLTERDIYITHNRGRGPSTSRNIAKFLCRGDFIMFLDDDDTVSVDIIKLSNHIQNLNNFNPVYFDFNIISEVRSPEGRTESSRHYASLSNIIINDIYIKNAIPIHCIIYPAALIKDISFDEKMRAYEDWDFLLQVIQKKPNFVHVPITGVNLHHVDGGCSDRRGSSNQAQNFYAVLDYLYTYHRNPAPSYELKLRRSNFMASFGINIQPEFL